ncbi:MAG: sensor histidine kinase [Calditrichaeota bacterium]|nr:sensor histidine kinase [Calditrichota bacterium]
MEFLNFQKGEPTSLAQQIFLAVIILLLIALISFLHYSTPTNKWQFHIIYMQSYFIPILIGALQFGVKGGLGSAIVISLIYFPHIMLQWGGINENNLLRFIQIVLFNVIGYFTGLKAEREAEEKRRFQEVALQLQQSFRKIQEQATKLAELEEQLRITDRLAIVGELSASLAHEVRNPLGAIQGAVEILRDEVPKDPNTEKFFDILLQETRRLSDVVENYLGLARKDKHVLSKFDVREVLQTSMVLFEKSAQKAGIDMEMDLPDFPVILYGDAIQLQQIMLNLLLNAREAMPHGGKIEIRCRLVSGAPAETKPTHQDESDTSNASVPSPENIREWVCISVQDSGVGIPPENLHRIFDPFFTTKARGTGLGLAIVKRIVEKNGWRISVDSQPGEGTRFDLYIPRTKKQGES